MVLFNKWNAIEGGRVFGLFEMAELDNILMQLDEIYREVIDLRYNHDLKLDEISRIMDIPTGTVKSRLNKAHKIIREQYFEEEVTS